jgi:hypothetical protein
MAITVMRNRVTTEYKKVEADSEEFWELRAELHTDGRPRWEQTGEHDLAAFEGRLDSGNLRAEDVGDDNQPVQRLVTEDQGNQAGLDRGWPTAGEIEQKAGRAAEMSEEELADAARAYGVGSEGYPAGHPPEVDPDEAEEAGVTLGGTMEGGISGGGAIPEKKAEKVEEAQTDVQKGSSEKRKSSSRSGSKSQDKPEQPRSGRATQPPPTPPGQTGS